MNPHCDLCWDLQEEAASPWNARGWLVVHVRAGELAWWVGVGT